MHLFFNLKGDIEEVAGKVFHALDIKDRYLEGDSANVFQGVYYSYSAFGINLKLEYNSYDYDDVYKYMFSIRKDLVTPLNGIGDDIVSSFGEVVANILAKNINTDFAVEIGDGELKIVKI